MAVPKKYLNTVTGNFILMTSDEVSDDLCSKRNKTCYRMGFNCLFEIRKIAVCFLWLPLPGDYRVTDEALLSETT